MSFEAKLDPDATRVFVQAAQNDPRQPRERLLEGIADAVAEKGYADTTIADIVAAAKVSKRTFYQHFSSKEECFTALYVTASTRSLMVLRDVVDTSLDWHTQVERAVSAYLEHLAANPLRCKTLYIEVLRMGTPGLALRRSAHDRFASWIIEVLSAKRPLSEETHAIAFALARAVVGGIHELVLEAIESGDPARLMAVVAPASQLVRAVFDSGISPQ
jgi:AcrR family transcriptional regulator